MFSEQGGRDGEAKPGLVERRDERMEIDRDETRQERTDLIPMARPQAGVDALKEAFPGPTESIPGVEDKNAQANGNVANPESN